MSLAWVAAKFMENKDLAKGIQNAITDYFRYAPDGCIAEMSEDFVERLAADAVWAKAGLRDLFRQSPSWDESLQSIVINGQRAREPDMRTVLDLCFQLIRPASILVGDAWAIGQFLADPARRTDEAVINVLERLAPGSYHSGKKPARVFRDLCRGLGIADEAAGSSFQRLYAKLADELSTRKLDFKLFLSIHPAHFLTMSNPKEDRRGETLVSCHSLNCEDGEYVGGCTGYARDQVSFLAFTVSDPDNPQALNNRKTSRQLFAYRPGSGLLFQSRMYNASGGVVGPVGASKVYRDLVQRELSVLEGAANLWKAASLPGDNGRYIRKHEEFSGYPDWQHYEYGCKVAFRSDCDREKVLPLVLGAEGLCIQCGRTAQHGFFCDRCENPGMVRCDCCLDYFPEGSLFAVYGQSGDEEYVCEYCAEEYTACASCGDAHHSSVMVDVGAPGRVCPECATTYRRCSQCRDLVPEVLVEPVYGESGYRDLCHKCITQVSHRECPRCGVYVETVLQNCHICGAEI